MKANYGYADATGEYYIQIDTDKCDGCGECVKACPEGLFEIMEDDYGKMVAAVKEEARAKVGYLCPGFHLSCHRQAVNCQSVCRQNAITHSW